MSAGARVVLAPSPVVSGLNPVQEKFQALLSGKECPDTSLMTMAMEPTNLHLEFPLSSYWLHDLGSPHPSDLSFLSCEMGIQH